MRMRTDRGKFVLIIEEKEALDFARGILAEVELCLRSGNGVSPGNSRGLIKLAGDKTSPSAITVVVEKVRRG